MKKILAALTALAFGSGLALVAVAMPASATTPTIPDAYCSPVFETQPNPDYIPEVLEISHVEIVTDSPEILEVSHTEYLYKQLVTGKTKWQDSLTWNPGLGWYYAHETRSVIDVAYSPAVTHEETIIDVAYQAPVGEPTIEVQTGEWCEGWWTSQTTFLNENPQGADDVSWPQTILGAGKLAAECGQQLQLDFWAGTRAQIEAIIADGQLSRVDGTPEDSQVVKAWEFAEGPVCVPVKPEPRPYSDQGSEFTCELVTEWTEEGVFDLTLIENVWVENELPTFERHSTERVPTEAELLARGCVEAEEPPVVNEPPVEEPVTPAKVSTPDGLAYTSLNPGVSWALMAALAALIAGSTIGAYRLSRRQQ